jgi:hypothetical protein
VNAAATGSLTQRPFALSTVTMSAPGGLAGVAGATVLASVDDVPVAAVWGADQVTGGGRVVLVMDINWTEPLYQEATTAAQFAQNVALFLSGRASPPAPPAAAVAGSRSPADGAIRTTPSTRAEAWRSALALPRRGLLGATLAGALLIRARLANDGLLAVAAPALGLAEWFLQDNAHGLVVAYGFVLGALVAAIALTRSSGPVVSGLVAA